MPGKVRTWLVLENRVFPRGVVPALRGLLCSPIPVDHNWSLYAFSVEFQRTLGGLKTIHEEHVKILTCGINVSLLVS